MSMETTYVILGTVLVGIAAVVWWIPNLPRTAW
jgi:hypothetical protein